MRRLPAVAVAAALLFLLGPPTGATAAGGADVFVYMDGPTTAYVGQTLYYDIGSGNRGPDVATGVVLTDTMPAGTTFLPSQSDPCWTQSGTTLTCRIGYEYANAVGETRLALRAPDTAGSVTNAVRITMDQTDPTPADDAASLTTSITVPTDADIEVDLNAVSDRVEVGSYAYFDVGVVNNGPADATGVSITDQLPDGMVFVPSMSDAACAAAGQTITCTVGFVGNHAVTDPYRITAQTTKLGSFTDTATATANQPDPNLSNNSASTTVTVFGPADLSLTMTGPQTVDVRTTNAFTLDITNAGPDATSATTLDVSLAPQMSPAGWSASQGSCQSYADTTPSRYHCDLGGVPAGATVHVVLQAYAYVDGTGTTQATVASDRPDPDQSNNSASVTTTVVPVADIQVMGGSYVTPVKAHRSTVTFTITVYNAGPSTATSVTLTDRWTGTMNQLDLSSISADQGACSKTGGTTAVCRIGTLAPGAAATVTVTLTAQGSGTVTDTASGTASEKDSDTANNTAVITAST